MFDDTTKRGFEFCGKHVYKILRWNNGKGGASKTPQIVIEDDIMGLFTHKINNYQPLLTFKRNDVDEYDILIPSEFHEWIRTTNKFVSGFGYSQILTNTLMDTIIDMTRFGIHDVKDYRKFIERLDTMQAGNFHEFIQICIEFEKEMKQ